MEIVRRTDGTQAWDEIVLEADEARQGVTGHNVRYVLGFGLGGTVLGLVIVGYFAFTGAL